MEYSLVQYAESGFCLAETDCFFRKTALYFSYTGIVSTGLKGHMLFTGTFMRMNEAYGSKFEGGIETEHSVLIPRGGPNGSFFENLNQGGNKISAESNISKSIKRTCLETLRRI